MYILSLSYNNNNNNTRQKSNTNIQKRQFGRVSKKKGREGAYSYIF